MPWPELSFTQRMLIAGMALLTVLRWVLAGSLELSPPEALLAEWTRHPSLAGLHGGFGTACWAWAGSALAGWTPLGIRFFAPLLAVLASAVLYRLVNSLSGEKAAAWSVALLNLTPEWNFASIFLKPEMPGMLFGLCGMAAIWRALRRASAWDWHWPLAGMLFGAGALCSYSALWGPVSTLVLLAGSRRWRRQLLRPGPWIMLADVALLLWPLWQWNRENALAGWYCWTGRMLPPGGFTVPGPLVLAGKWALVLTPPVMAAMGWAMVMGLKRWNRSDNARFFAAYAVTPVAGALAGSFYGGAEASWIAPALPALCALLPWAWEQVLSGHLVWKQRFQWLTVVPALMITPLMLDSRILRHMTATVQPAPDPSREWRGWQATVAELTRIIGETARQTGDDGKGGRNFFLIARDERLAAILNFYLPRDLPLRRPAPGHPLVHTVESPVIENAFHTWPRYDFVKEGRSRFAGCTALYITDGDDETGPPPGITGAFQSSLPAALFDVAGFGQPLRRIRVFACLNYRGLPR